MIYAYPLDEDRRRFFSQQNLGRYPSVEEVRDTTSHWRNVWNETNRDNRIVLTLQELTKRVPTRSLECFIIGGGIKAMSTPFIISVRKRNGEERSDQDFIETLIHEAAHIFVSDVPAYFDSLREKYSGSRYLPGIIYSFTRY